MALSLFGNVASTTALGTTGATQPASGTAETWNVTSTGSPFPQAVTGTTQFHVADPTAPTELIAVTNTNDSTHWAVIRGAEGTTPVPHTAGFTIWEVVSAGDLTAMTQGLVAPAPLVTAAPFTAPAISSASTILTVTGVPSPGPFVLGNTVYLTGTGTPTGVAYLQTYYVVSVSGFGWTSTAGGTFTFGVAATPGGSAISVTIPACSAGLVTTAGQLTPVDATAGNVTIALPQAPSLAGALAAVKMVNTASSHTTTIQSLGTDLIGRSEGYTTAAAATTATLSLMGQGQVLSYTPAGTAYTVNNTPTAGTSSSSFVITGVASPGPYLAGQVAYLTLTGGSLTGASVNTDYYVISPSWSSGSGGTLTFSLATTYNGSAFSATLPSATTLIQSCGTWTTVSDDLPLSQLDARYVLESVLPLPLASGGTGVNAASDAALLSDLGALPVAGGTMSGAIAMGSNKITGLANGSSTADAAAYGQVLPIAGGTMSGALNPAVVTLSFQSGGTTTVSATSGNMFELAMSSGGTTLGAPSGGVDGQAIRIRVTADSGSTLSFTTTGTNCYDFGTAGAPTLSTTTGKVDVLGFEYNGSLQKWCCLGSGLGF